MRKKSSTPTTLEIYLLGPFRILVDGQAIDERQLTRRKPKQLIKLLALQPHHQLHRDQAMEFLWPDSDPESGANNLHKAIHMARHALEPSLKSVAESHFILTQGQQVLLRAPDRLWIDVEDFEQRVKAAQAASDIKACEEARALYGGELLAEDRYEDWAVARREQLQNRHQELLAKLARLYEAGGEHQAAIERLQSLLIADGANEETHRHLMRLYALTGNKHQALRQYQLCCDALQKDLDAEPEQQTRELHRQIISGQLAPLPLSAGIDAGDRPDSDAVNSLAIFPFINSSADPNAEYLSDGITESIINNLSQLPKLKVIARSTVFRYKGEDLDPQEVGKKLGVRTVLTGRVLSRGDVLNIQTELVNVKDGTQLWGEQHERSCSDIFEVQEEIAKEIAAKLRLRLSGEEKGLLSKRYTANTEAYHLYLKGRYHWNKRTSAGFEKGLECFRQAIAIDPDYALAYAGISDCHAFRGDVGTAAVPSREAFSRAKQAALQALEIDDRLAEAQASLAHANMHCFEWAAAEQAFKRAIDLNYNHAQAHQWYAFYLLFNAQPDRALVEARRALELDPLSLTAHGDLGQIYFYSRQYDQATEVYDKTLELDPNRYRVYLWIGLIYEQKRMYDDAIAAFLKAKTDEVNTEVLASLGSAYALAGKRAEALSVSKELQKRSAQHYVSPYNRSLLFLSLGEKDKAFEWLERAYDERAEWMIYLSVDPRFDSLRSEPEFRDILCRIGFAS
jgi:DNA-binding SARP family transcriptional activator/TolB-like protein/Tfp pilus assembly protein PilF